MQTRITGHTGADGGAMDAHTGPLAGNGQSSRSMAELLRELSTESGDLVRQEVDLELFTGRGASRQAPSARAERAIRGVRKPRPKPRRPSHSRQKQSRCKSPAAT